MGTRIEEWKSGGTDGRQAEERRDCLSAGHLRPKLADSLYCDSGRRMSKPRAVGRREQIRLRLLIRLLSQSSADNLQAPTSIETRSLFIDVRS